MWISGQPKGLEPGSVSRVPDKNDGKPPLVERAPSPLRVPWPIYVISSSAERFSFMQMQFDFLQLRSQCIDAFADTNLPSWLAEQFTPEPAINSVEIRRYAGHLLALSHLVESGHEAAIVVEDDVELSRDFMDTAVAAVAAVPRTWDIVHLASNQHWRCRKLSELRSGRWLVRPYPFPSDTAAYIVSWPAACKILVQRKRSRPYQAEFRFPWLVGLDLYAVQPCPAEQFNTFHDTAPKGRNNRAGWRPRVLARMQGVFYMRRTFGTVGTLTRWLFPVVSR